MNPYTCLTGPWSKFIQAPMHFCEANSCGWIAWPADTWSNVGYVLVGIWILRIAKRESGNSFFGWAAVLVGFLSAAFHGTGTQWGFILDVSSMFPFSVYFITANTKRLWPALFRDEVDAPLFFLITLALSVVLLRLWPAFGVNLFIIHCFIWGIEELILGFKEPWWKGKYKPLAKLVGCFVVAYSFWWLDTLGILCNPNNHILTGHSVWHLTNAFCFYFAYRFYEGLRK